jgi:hypothetical protein
MRHFETRDVAAQPTLMCSVSWPAIPPTPRPSPRDAETKESPKVRRRRAPIAAPTRYDRVGITAARTPAYVPVTEIAAAPKASHRPAPLWLMMLLLALMSGSGVLSALRPQLPIGLAQQVVALVAR